MDLCSPRELNALLTRHGFRFSKSMGQNFLIDGRVPRDIATASGANKDCGVLEIGPGVGSLTAELSKLAGQVVSVELDRSLLPVLAESLADCVNVEIVPGDIMKLDLSALVDEKLFGFTPIACANLPYNITTPAITALLECGRFASVTVMIQREVARRICAVPGTADYGAFTLLCQYYARCSLLFDVPPHCFLPAPKVTSSVVRLELQPPPPEVEDREFFFSVVRTAFAQRRKTLLNALSAAFGGWLTKEELRQAIAACGLPEDIRGERLDLAAFAALARELAGRMGG